MLGNVKTLKEAWDILHKIFISKTWAQILHLKECLSCLTKGSKHIAEYLNGIKSISNELVISSPLDDVDMVIHTLNGFGAEYREVFAALRTQKNSIGFEDFYDLHADFENYLKRDKPRPNSIATAHVVWRP